MTEKKRKSQFNPRVYTSRSADELRAEMERLGAEPPGVVRMLRKANHFVVKVHDVRTPVILILKEEMLAKGGDCAIHRDAIVNRVDRSDCLLIGTEKAFTQMINELIPQPFDLPRLAKEIRAALDAYRKGFTVPADESLPANLRAMYSAMKTRTLVMGILNVTPDSFSDGGLHVDPTMAVKHGVRMVEVGADIIDIGGESTRPGAEPVSIDREIARVLPVIGELSTQVSVPISIDTCKPEVARAALDAGASIINDITGFTDPGMRSLAAERRAPSIIMHMQGTPQTMQENPVYEDPISDIMLFLRRRIDELVEAGLPREYAIIDPGIGFGKTYDHNLEIIRKLGDLRSLGTPILMGTSRKGFIGKALGGVPASERVFGTAATVALCINNGANIVRVHDVQEMSQVARMTDEILRR